MWTVNETGYAKQLGQWLAHNRCSTVLSCQRNESGRPVEDPPRSDLENLSENQEQVFPHLRRNTIIRNTILLMPWEGENMTKWLPLNQKGRMKENHKQLGLEVKYKNLPARAWHPTACHTAFTCAQACTHTDIPNVRAALQGQPLGQWNIIKTKRSIIQKLNKIQGTLEYYAVTKWCFKKNNYQHEKVLRIRHKVRPMRYKAHMQYDQRCNICILGDTVIRKQ